MHLTTGSYRWPQRVRIRASTSDERAAAQFLLEFLEREGVHGILVSTGEPVTHVTLYGHEGFDPGLGDEGYTLTIEATGLSIKANKATGLFYGLQTLEQLTSAESGHQLESQFAAITDWPAYRWRGIHLDVSRHFFSVSTVKRFIDLAARYKLNVFHWHLTDDQGWRIEIKRYPLLTKVGSCGTADSCQYYSQDQIREVVRYASKRHVTVVPEIEMPGHSMAAIASYPELGCARVRHPRVYCPNQRTFTFLENVLSEVVDLFPGRVLHIGGDEVATKEWESDATVSALMRSKHIANYAELQAYFMGRISRFITTRGRLAIAWDEVLDGKLPYGLMVMSWRGRDTAIAAARLGHDVVLTPDGALYFDGYQGDRFQEPSAMRYVSTLEEVYRYDPGFDYLSAGVSSHLLGLQANLWTEQIETSEHLFYMLLPRELALSEISWLPVKSRNWDSFNARLPQQFTWLEGHHYPFRIPNPVFTVSGGRIVFAPITDHIQSAIARTDSRTVSIELSAPISGKIRYTTDGSAPVESSMEYRSPMRINLTPGQAVNVQAATFLLSGRRSTVSQCTIRRSSRASLDSTSGGFPSWSSLMSSQRAEQYSPP